MSRSGFYKNTSWLIGGQFVRMIIQFLIGIVSARYLGPSNYGIINYVSTYINLFAILCELGLTNIIVNELVSRRNSEGTIVGTAIAMRMIASFLSTICLIIIVSIIDRNNPVVLYVLILRSLSLFFDSFSTIKLWFQSNLQSKYYTIYQLISYITAALYKVYLLITKASVQAFAFSLSLDYLVLAFLLFFGYKKHKGQKLSFSTIEVKNLLMLGSPFIVSGIMVFVYGQMDRILLNKMVDSTAVGLYSASNLICALIGFIISSIMKSGEPVILMQKKLDNGLYIKRFKQIIAAVLWIAISYSIFLQIFGKYILLIMYGEEYSQALPVLRVLTWAAGLSYLGTLRNTWLICEKKTKYVKLFSLVGVITNLFLNIILIPIYGIVGSAIATVSTELITSFAMPFIVKETREFAIMTGEALILKNLNIKRILRLLINSFKNKFINK